MKRYHLRKSILIKLQGLILILLAMAAHNVNADDIMIVFATIGILMFCSSTHHYIYKLAKKIVRYGNKNEWYLTK